MRTILISFKPNVYEKIALGKKIYEYRRSFPEGLIKAYMYVSSPVCAIKGIVYLDNRHSLHKWRQEYSYDTETVKRIDEYLQKVNYAAEITKFVETNEIKLGTLRDELCDFVVPQMYYFVDGKPLLEFLEKNLQIGKNIITHDFSNVTSELICRH